MTTAQKIDKLLRKGLTNAEIVAKGFSLSTVKYRRAKMFFPESYKAYKERSRKIMVERRKLSTAQV